MDIYIRWPGSVHVYIFTNTDLFAKEKKVPFCQIQGEWLMPAAYRYWFWVITPIHYFPGPIHYNLYTSLVNNEGCCESGSVTAKQRHFNYRLALLLAVQCTICVRCMGVLLMRRGVFASAEIPSSGAAGMTSTGSNNSIRRWIRTALYRKHNIWCIIQCAIIIK